MPFPRQIASRLARVVSAAALVIAALGSPPAAHADLGAWMAFGQGRYTALEETFGAFVTTPEGAIATNFAPLCVARSRLKRYRALFECLERLEARIADGDDKVVGFMIPESNLRPLPGLLRATASLELGEPARAAIQAREALALIDDEDSSWGPFPPMGYRAELAGVLGLALALDGRRPQAEQVVAQLEALDLSDTQGQKYENLQDVLLARIYMAFGAYDKALERLRDEKYTEVRFLTDLLTSGEGETVGAIYEIGNWLIVGTAQARTGKVAEARDTLDKLLAHPQLPDQGDVHWIALHERGRLAAAAGERDAAIGFYRRAIEVIERQRSSLATEAGKIGFVGDKQAVYFGLVEALIGAGRIAGAFEVAERAKARALVDLLASKRDFAVPGKDPGRAREILARLDRADLDAHALGAEATVRSETVRTLSLARTSLQESAPELASLISVTTVPLAELQGLLPEGETLIEYYGHGSALLAFVVRRDVLRVVRLDATGLDAAVRGLRDAIAGLDGARAAPLAQALYARLIAPLESEIRGTLSVVPHAQLHYLPFAVLTDAAGGALIERWGYRVLPSASVLRYLRAPLRDPSAPVLAFGNPDLGDPKLALAHAEAEARAIAALVPGSRLALRADATETTFKQAAALFRRLHLATHGEFDAEHPLQSGLLMSRDASNDGRLSVGDLYSLTIDADLVTLSACETGLGKVANGDDVVGLARGFLYAGARSIVSSLWSVDDRATAELMRTFYENLGRMDKREALRQAALTTRAAFPQPFYWGAFQLTGRAD